MADTKTPAERILEMKAQLEQEDPYHWKTGDMNGLQQGLFRGIQAAVTGKNIPQAVLQQNAGKLTGADVTDAISSKFGITNPYAQGAIATGLDLADPATLIAPEAKAGTIMGATVSDLAKQNVAKDVAARALQSGSMNEVNQVVRKSADDLINIIPRSKPTGLDVLQGSRVPANARGMKMISGANEIANPAIKPANMSRVAVPTRPAAETAAAKLSTAAAQNEGIKFAPSVRDPKQQAKVLQILEKLKAQK